MPFMVESMLRLRVVVMAWRRRASSPVGLQRGRNRAGWNGNYYVCTALLKVFRKLQQQGVSVSENRVARLMRSLGIKGRWATLRYTSPNLKKFFGSLPNQQYEHPAETPNQVWVADITYLKAGSIYRYLAVVMDRCSRRIIGWALGQQRNVVLTLRAFYHAVSKRRPPPGLIFHTDRGIEYYAHAFRERLQHLQIIQSMNRPGKVTDNAFMESFFHSMKADVMAIPSARMDNGYRYCAAIFLSITTVECIRLCATCRQQSMKFSWHNQVSILLGEDPAAKARRTLPLR